MPTAVKGLVKLNEGLKFVELSLSEGELVGEEVCLSGEDFQNWWRMDTIRSRSSGE